MESPWKALGSPYSNVREGSGTWGTGKVRKAPLRESCSNVFGTYVLLAQMFRT